MQGSLTTHVLDTTNGRPAAGIDIALWRLEGGSSEDQRRVLLKRVRTNADGRTDEPLLAEGELTPGVYELVFSVSEYFDPQGTHLPTPAFLQDVPVRFGIADPSAHYHVPLLASPWAYNTYRGS